MKPLYQEHFLFYFIVFLGGTINAACDRNLCKLFTIKKNQGKKKGSGCFSQEKFKLFFFTLQIFVIWGVICHDLLCLNVFECLLFIQNLCM